MNNERNGTDTGPAFHPPGPRPSGTPANPAPAYEQYHSTPPTPASPPTFDPSTGYVGRGEAAKK